MNNTHIIYIPGFGDGYDKIRRQLLGKWRRDNVTVELVPMNWGSDESFGQKLVRINQVIDRAHGKRVVLIGESASGSMALHIYAARPDGIARVITLCGKNSNPTNVKPHYFAKYPSFKESMDRLEDSIALLDARARRRFTSVHPIYDPVVAVADTWVPGCRDLTLRSVGHLVVIFQALTMWSGKIIDEALREGQNPKA